MKKILVVDDDKDLLLAMKLFFQRLGYIVAVTVSCDEGMDIFHSFQPDLVFLDINVGDQDGRQMCRKIKTQAENQHIPVILISANEEGLKSYREYGATFAIRKPFKMEELIEVLKTIY